jgi:hypothetical protein
LGRKDHPIRERRLLDMIFAGGFCFAGLVISWFGEVARVLEYQEKEKKRKAKHTRDYGVESERS